MPERTPTGPVSQQNAAGAGAVKAAAVLLGLGPEASAAILRNLDEASIRRIAQGSHQLRSAGVNVVTALNEFVTALDAVGGDLMAADGVLREWAVKALGADAARRVFDVVRPLEGADLLGPAATADPEALAVVLAREQTQTIALVLSVMEPPRAEAVIRALPAEIKPRVLRRLAALDAVTPEVVQDVGRALSTELRSSSSAGVRRVDGRATVVEILRRIPAAQQNEALQDIDREDPELASELRSRLFTFEDLVNLSDKDVQALLREVDNRRLAVALKGAASGVRDKILGNMSQRAAEVLGDEIASMGPVKLAEVEQAQRDLLKAAFALAEQGRITLVNPADQMV